MATDWWPEQSGRLTDGLTIMCNAYDANITEGACVKSYATNTASQLLVQIGASIGDSWGIALKACASAGEAVPVLAYGLYKCTLDSGSTGQAAGKYVVSGATPTHVTTNPITAVAKLCAFGGSSYILGMALQASTAGSDSIIVFVGKGI